MMNLNTTDYGSKLTIFLQPEGMPIDLQLNLEAQKSKSSTNELSCYKTQRVREREGEGLQVVFVLSCIKAL